MRDPELMRRATELWQEAYRHQLQGDLERAIEFYQRSIGVCPTAEAHTFLGWTLSFQGRLEEATRECLKAIEVDPDFGNPYNDIGCYLMQQGDRKSTRLNSSHTVISYAVFCLQKKNPSVLPGPVQHARLTAGF